MPMGKYADFDACLADQQMKGKSKESAQKICGFIKARVEGTKKEKTKAPKKKTKKKTGQAAKGNY